MVEEPKPPGANHIGRYRILRRLGEGGMGEVLLGVGPDGRLVAIKRVHAHLLGESDFIPRFRREAQTSAKVSGAFTAAVVDFDVDSDNPWLASVFVPGIPLDKAVQRFGPLPPDSIRALAIGLAAALQAIHRVGLVHRDLKPANIILAEDGPRVIDFGIARVAEERSDLTHTGSIIGSPAYMSPEQAQSMPLTPAGDIFSLGSVIVMAAGGTSPFAGASMPQTLYNVVHIEPDLSMLPFDVRQLVEPCLRKDPAARPTPSQIIDFLGSVSTGGKPWPTAIHEAIRAQEQELRALIADPEATVIVDPVPSVDAPIGHDFDYAMARVAGASNRHRRRRIVMALVTVLLLAAGSLTGVMVFGDGGTHSDARDPNPLAGLNLTRLRLIDTCKLLEDPTSPTGEPWTREPTEQESPASCARITDKLMFAVDINDISGYRKTGENVQGIPILAPAEAQSDACRRALMPAETHPQYGIIMEVARRGTADADQCAVANEAVGQLAGKLRTPPILENYRGSLIRLDPCSVVSPTTVRLNVGPPAPGKLTALHSCEWVGMNTMTVSLRRVGWVSESPPIQLRDIQVRRAGPGDDDTRCGRVYEYKSYGAGGIDRLEVDVSRPSGGSEAMLCGAAEQAISAIVHQQLPRGR